VHANSIQNSTISVDSLCQIMGGTTLAGNLTCGDVDNATIAVFANNKGGVRAAMLWPFVAGLCQVFGSALIAGWVGMAAYGGYLGMWDWAVVWPVFTVVMKYLSYAGVAIIALVLLAIPQIQYRMNKETYFLVTEDYEAYKVKKAEELAAKG
ncbi:MAG: hypothetical protein MUO40_10355, partial [Anaerolineaceae bacterium]|nr:hypothetical protein [Anaerolineaceae bacterium]